MGHDGNVYSGSYDSTIRVWSASDGTHLHTLEEGWFVELEGWVYALAVMRDGTLVSGGMQLVEEEYECDVNAELKMW